MGDQSVSAVGWVGRAITLFGLIWLGFAILGGIGILSELGLSAPFLAGIGGSIIPGLVLLAVGRAIRRRASTTESRTGPAPDIAAGDQARRVPTTRVEHTSKPAPPTVPTLAPDRDQVTANLEEVLGELEDDSSTGVIPRPLPRPVEPRPKTSQELIDEARNKWGAGRKA